MPASSSSSPQPTPPEHPARVRAKICGLTRPEDVAACVEAGADAIGLVFFPESPRHVAPAQAAALLTGLPPFVQSVGLFVNPDPAWVRAVLEAVPLDLLQFHGDEEPGLCVSFGRPYIKALRVRPGTDLVHYAHLHGGARGLLLDAWHPGAWGGTGQTFDWSLIPQGLQLPVVLSGGLDEHNVGAAIRAVRPYAVDVSSGVEVSRGIKHAGRIRAFMDGVRQQ